MVITARSDNPRKEACGGGVVTEGFFDARHEIGQRQRLVVGNDTRERDIGRAHFGLDFAIDVGVGEYLQKAGADYRSCGVGACESVTILVS